MESYKLTAAKLKSLLTDDDMIETLLMCFKDGETVELKREDGKIVVIGIKRKLKLKCL